MTLSDVIVVIQARMSSSRFPGKVLAPLDGVPVLRHVVAAVTSALPAQNVIVATSVEVSDDPLAAYAATLGVAVVRGPLDNVIERFRMCARSRSVTWIGRVNADSPLLDPNLVGRVLAERTRDRFDLITTVFPRTFPRGQNVELMRAETLLSLEDQELMPADREHVTAFFYRHPERFAIHNVESGNPALALDSTAVDTLEDLQRLNARVRSATS
jgi:spore coat polysaccharide biosynthesis protein SpsF